MPILPAMPGKRENRELRSSLRLILMSGLPDCVKEQCFSLKTIKSGLSGLEKPESLKRDMSPVSSAKMMISPSFSNNIPPFQIICRCRTLITRQIVIVQKHETVIKDYENNFNTDFFSIDC